QAGPVFWRGPVDGRLRMRYTARTRSIVWRADTATQAARTALEAVLADGDRVLNVRLDAGMGLICNNVLHTRSAFDDAAGAQRRVLRARYLDRVGG
ncbi:MAG: taurine catabolism dioxygenase TauD, partial [Burkholderiaceae bacterium]